MKPKNQILLFEVTSYVLKNDASIYLLKILILCWKEQHMCIVQMQKIVKIMNKSKY